MLLKLAQTIAILKEHVQTPEPVFAMMAFRELLVSNNSAPITAVPMEYV